MKLFCSQMKKDDLLAWTKREGQVSQQEPRIFGGGWECRQRWALLVKNVYIVKSNKNEEPLA